MIADWKCLKCGEEFEYMSVKSDDKPECPKCKAKEKDLEKKISTKTSFVLNGRGWFKKGGY